MTPYYQDDLVTIYHGDSRDVIPSIPMVDAVITDPPYSSGGMYRSDRATPTNVKYQIDHETTRSYGTFSGDNRDQRSFEKWVRVGLSRTHTLAQGNGPAAEQGMVPPQR